MATLTIEEQIAKYRESRYWSPAYNSVFGYHNGSFFKALCEAIFRADKDNSEILEKAYPELYEIMAFLNNGNFCRDDIDKWV